jgi:hypothetical protein
VLVFGAGSLLLPPLVIAREGSLGAHDRPIGAAVSDITGLSDTMVQKFNQ